MPREGVMLALVVALVSALGQSLSAAEPVTAKAVPAQPPDAEMAARLRAATAAIEADPRSVMALERRAALYLSVGQYPQAIADYDATIKLQPNQAELYDRRGSAQFMAGQIDASIADFDRFIKLRPDQEPWHWKRGISYYYAGRYDDGRRQFEGYQTVDDNDVENAVWRYLCMARAGGVPAARDAMLKIKRDTRVPMAEVYALYSGKAQPEDVLAAARAGDPSPEALNTRLFYAHLYLGLYYEVAGDAALAREHITTAADQHRIGHYMWNVADVHARRLKMPAAAN